MSTREEKTRTRKDAATATNDDQQQQAPHTHGPQAELQVALDAHLADVRVEVVHGLVVPLRGRVAVRDEVADRADDVRVDGPADAHDDEAREPLLVVAGGRVAVAHDHGHHAELHRAVVLGVRARLARPLVRVLHHVPPRLLVRAARGHGEDVALRAGLVDHGPLAPLGDAVRLDRVRVVELRGHVPRARGPVQERQDQDDELEQREARVRPACRKEGNRARARERERAIDGRE